MKKNRNISINVLCHIEVTFTESLSLFDAPETEVFALEQTLTNS